MSTPIPVVRQAGDGPVVTTNASGAGPPSTAEAAFAFVLGADLARGATAADVLSATDFVVPAIVALDDGGLPWTVEFGTSPLDLSEVDIRLRGVVLYRNGEVADTAAGGAVLGSPVHAVAWLAGRQALPAGGTVVIGSVTAAVETTPGDTVAVTLAGGAAVALRVPA